MLQHMITDLRSAVVIIRILKRRNPALHHLVISEPVVRHLWDEIYADNPQASRNYSTVTILGVWVIGANRAGELL